MKTIAFILCLIILIKIAPAQQVKPVNHKVDIKRKISVFPGIINDQMISENGFHTLHFKMGQHEYEVVLHSKGLANFNYNTLYKDCENGACKIIRS